MPNPFSLEGRNFLVTGASSGIGRACLGSISENGGNVIAVGRDRGRLEESLHGMDSDRCFGYQWDLQKVERIAELVGSVVRVHGKVSGLVHCAGIDATAPLALLKAETFNNAFKINALAFFELVRVLSKRANCGLEASFVAMASVRGMFGARGCAAYCASKAALINGVRSLALELAPKKIRVNSVSPAFVKTKMLSELEERLGRRAINAIGNDRPLGFGESSDIANAVVFLLAPASKWITGTNLVADGGYSAGS